jgi:hypothetical protein
MQETPEQRLRLAFELFDAGIAIMRENLRRRRPHASREEIQASLNAWLQERPGAEHGDAVGRARAGFPTRA